MIIKQKKAFTLAELIVVLAVLAILAVLLIPKLISYVNQAKAASDLQTLSVLNTATKSYKLQSPDNNPFNNSNSTNTVLMQALVDNRYIQKAVTPRQEGASFKWFILDTEWVISFVNSVTGQEIIMGTGGHKGYIKGSYSGEYQEILIPSTIDGQIVTNIYQDVFNNKNLTSVEFADDSQIIRIHARAFANNDLTEIDLPDSLTRIDYGAFMGNDITKVTIGSGVYLEDKVFQNNNKFRDAYNAGGAGTYLYINGEWVKQ
ncbi:MAG: leucine-rich repeat protein [Eubacteriaceae bacterium]|nr:leucine-rich repeat protein [Eubacteriaceae bacterium]